MTDLTTHTTTRTVDGVQISATAVAPLTPLVNDVLDISNRSVRSGSTSAR